MTVLEAEEDTDERPNPPRKKLCLSLSKELPERRNQGISKNKSETQPGGRAGSGQTRPTPLGKNTLTELNYYYFIRHNDEFRVHIESCGISLIAMK